MPRYSVSCAHRPSVQPARAPPALVPRPSARSNLLRTVKPSHFGLALHVGDVPVPLRLLALSPLGVQLRLGFLALLLRLGQSLLAQLAGQRPGEGQAAATRHVGQLFGTVGGGVGLVDVVEAVVVHLVEAVLQRQDGREAVAPLDLAADVRAPRLARHAWRRNAEIHN